MCVRERERVCVLAGGTMGVSVAFNHKGWVWDGAAILARRASIGNRRASAVRRESLLKVAAHTGCGILQENIVLLAAAQFKVLKLHQCIRVAWK